MEFNACLDLLQEAILACRPRNIHTFAARYFNDEKSPYPEEAHSVHMLPFLLFHCPRFKNAAGTIYCHHVSLDNLSKQFLEPSVACSIIDRMDLPSLGLNIKHIDELTRIRVMSLKQVTFDLFLSSVRFHLASYQLVVWLHGKLVQIHEDVSIISYTTSGVALHGRGSSQGLSSSATGLSANGSAIHTVGANAGVLGCLCIAVPRSVELHKTKQWLLKESQLNAANARHPTSKYNSSALSKVDRWSSRRSCAYHMHEDPLVPPEPNHSTGTAANQSTGSEGDNASPQRHSSGSSSTLTGSSRGGATEGEAAVPPLCGVAHTEAESRLLLRLVGSTVDGLLESGAPNTVALEAFVDAFMGRYFKQLPTIS